jgi:chemotaxis protein CheD
MLDDELSKHRKRIIIHPGEYRISRESIVLSTLLGSCVAVCMYDPTARVMGMNHFLLVGLRATGAGPVFRSDAGRYGIHAMELLINGLLRNGAKRSRLKAKAFGGGNVLGTCRENHQGFECVSTANVRFVREFLEQDGIPLLAADLGGNFGRQIHFAGSDFSVYVRKIQSQQTRDLIEEERHYWREGLPGNPSGSVEFW